ncbi:hypothetical protein ACM66B_001366 [Microbotryomycetes sp. NB124-2]
MLRPRILALRSQLSQRFVVSVRRQHAPTKRGWLTPYVNQLRARYPNIDTPSLVASFLILHEVTAVVPLFVGFWTLKTLGVGAAVVGWIAAETPADEERGWLAMKTQEWMQQGQEQAAKIGRRYGVFGYSKETPEQRRERKQRQAEDEQNQNALPEHAGLAIGGDVANLVASYVAVKALLPLRILISLRLAPPMANSIVNRFRRLRHLGQSYLKKQG